MVFMTGPAIGQDMLINGHHEPWLVALSVAIAVLTAYMAFYVLGLSRRVEDTRVRRFLASLGGLVMGVGIWSMHFIGMLGFELDRSITFDPVITALSVIPAVAASILSLSLFQRSSEGWGRLMVASALFGAGIGAMHYIGMSAIEFNGFIRYDITMFTLSLWLAVLLAMIALWFLFHAHHYSYVGKKANILLAAFVMGSATSAMHYVAMHAAHFFGNEMGAAAIAEGTDPHIVAVVVALATLTLLGLVLFVVLREAMQQREHHQAVAEMEAWYRGIVESAPEGMLVADEQGTIILVNPVLESIFGYQAEEMLGQKIEMLVPASLRGGHVGLREGYVQQGVPRVMGASSQDLKGQRKDGSTFPVDVSLSVLPAVGRRGRCVFAAVRDITDRKKAEGELLNQRANLQKMLDMAPVGVAITVDGVTRFANPAVEEMLDMRVGDVAEKIYVDLSDRKKMRQDIDRDGFHHAEDILMKGMDGTVKDVMATFVRIDFEGKPGILGWLVDVTSIKRAELAMRDARDLAEQATRVKSDFLANMSHEIRTPMNAVIGMTHLLSKTTLDVKQRTYLNKIQQSSQHLLGVINDILDFSKIEAGRMTLEQIDFDLESVLENLANLIGDKIASKGLELIFDIDRRLPKHFIGDPLRLGQILINYANNAVKFTEKGEIVIMIRLVKMSGSDVEIYLGVKDTGIGLSPEQRDLLYQSFQQADTSTTRKFGGTGLGLVITKRITELMGGQVGVESRSGEGSTFWSTVKLGKSAITARPLVLSQDLQGQRVLVVDDNETARVVLQALLEQMKFDVNTAADGNEALQMVMQANRDGRPYHLAMLDWQMPGMDGLELAKRVRQLELHRHPYCFIVTAYGCEDIFRSVPGGVISDVLVKPVSASVLFDSIARVIGAEQSSEQQTVARPLQASAVGHQNLRGARVLLAEDNEVNQEVAVAILREIGLEVDVATNGQIALEMARKSKYDAILMDMQMPVMDGLQATREIRGQTQYRDVPILAMTANVTQADRDECLRAGMNDHIAKPIDPATLWKTLARWIAPSLDYSPVQGMQAQAVNPVSSHAQINPVDSPWARSLSELPGFDVNEGLSRVLGKKSLYESMLQKFLVGQSAFRRDFLMAISHGDMNTAQRLAHTLKGVAANIGAKSLSSLAAMLEHAVAAGEAPHAVQAKLDELTAALDALNLRLKPFFQVSQESHDSPGANISLDAIHRLLSLLADHDAESVDCFHEIAEGLKHDLPNHYVQIEHAIDIFDFDRAHHLLRLAISGEAG